MKNKIKKVNIWKMLAVLGIIIFLVLISSLFFREEKEKEEKIPLTDEQKQNIVKILKENYVDNTTIYKIKVDKEIKIINFEGTSKKIAKASFLSDNKTTEFTIDMDNYLVVQTAQIEYIGWMIDKKKQEKTPKDSKPKKWLHEDFLEKLFDDD